MPWKPFLLIPVAIASGMFACMVAAGDLGVLQGPLPAAADIKREMDGRGYFIVRNFYTPEEIESMRLAVYKAIHEQSVLIIPGKPGTPGLAVTDFLAQKGLARLHHLHDDPRMLALLDRVFGSREAYRFCAHNGLTVNSVFVWHKDTLKKQYARYQKLPLFEDALGDGGHFIIKVCIYLQDHSADDNALTLLPATHTEPEVLPPRWEQNVTTLHPAVGDIVVFEQRISHRGMVSGAPVAQDRVLLMFGYGKNNRYTDEFEAGTRRRQADQWREGVQHARIAKKKPFNFHLLGFRPFGNNSMTTA